ncbi:MAG: phosphopantothenoylcysteine decarboxylase, partial [Planctomycetota bacterium]
KSCDLMVLNGPEAIDSLANSVELLDAQGRTVASLTGDKLAVARGILAVIQQRFATRDTINPQTT